MFSLLKKYCCVTRKQFLLNYLCKMSLFTKKERSLIFSSLKMSCFLKSMLLLKFAIWWCLNILNLFNILILLNKSIFRWFGFYVTTKAQSNQLFEKLFWKIILFYFSNSIVFVWSQYKECKGSVVYNVCMYVSIYLRSRKQTKITFINEKYWVHSVRVIGR